ncbi:MAG: hypothetical protein QRY74_05000 [Chlamydia sp.]
MTLHRSAFYFLFTAFCIAFGFLSYRVYHLDQSLAILARPARLFNPNIIISKFANSPEWSVKENLYLDRFFYVLSQQQLNWLGKGAQALVFETQDEKYVVKFFQVGNIREESLGFFKQLYGSERQQRRKNQRHEMFSSSKVCFENLQEETGIIYVHLNKTEDKIKGVKLVDKFGQSHRIRGDDACFVVQKKAKYIIPTLTSLMDQGALLEAHKRVDQIFQLLLNVTKKGYVDGDDAVIRNNNLGFLENSAIYIDTGHIVEDQEVNIRDRMEYEFTNRLKPLEDWLVIQYPELSKYYNMRRDEIMNALNNSRLPEEIQASDVPEQEEQEELHEESYHVLV